MAKKHPKWVMKVFEKEKKERDVPLEIKEINANCYYLYHSTTRWSKSEKKSKKVSKYLGKITPKGLIVKGNVRKHASVYEFGAVKLLSNLIEESLDTPLTEHFYQYHEEIKAITLMKLLKDLPIKQMKDFWDKLYLSLEWNPSLSPSTVSAIYENIGRDLRTQYEYFSYFTKNEDHYAFDLSSIFSYSQNINLAEIGYNHNKIPHKQINFLMLYSIRRGLPVMLKPLPGSVRDIKSLKHELKNLTAKNLILVIDRGFASYPLADELNDHKNKIQFVMPLRRNFKIINYSLPLTNIFSYNGRGIKWGPKKTDYGTLYLFEDVVLAGEEESTFIELLESKKRKKKDYNNAKKKFGKIALLTNTKLSGQKVYLMYKEREGVEITFDAMKNLLEIDKTYLQTTEAVRGYFFIIFNALFLYYRILNILKKHDLNKKISVSDVLLLLSKVYMVDFGHKKQITEIPKKVEELIKKMNIKQEDIFPKKLRS